MSHCLSAEQYGWCPPYKKLFGQNHICLVIHLSCPYLTNLALLNNFDFSYRGNDPQVQYRGLPKLLGECKIKELVDRNYFLQPSEEKKRDYSFLKPWWDDVEKDSSKWCSIIGGEAMNPSWKFGNWFDIWKDDFVVSIVCHWQRFHRNLQPSSYSGEESDKLLQADLFWAVIGLHDL